MTQSTVRGPAAPSGFTANPPGLPTAIQQYFLPAVYTGQQAIGAWEQQTRVQIANLGTVSLAYKPVLLAQAAVRYQDRKTQLFTARVYAFQIPGLDRAGLVHWEEHQATPVDPKRVSGEPLGAALYGELSPGLTDPKRLTSLKGELVDMLYNTARLQVPYNPTLSLYGSADSPESEFHAQAQQMAHEKRDAEIDQLAAKYEKLMDAQEEKLKRKERELSAERKELADRKREEFFTRGEALLSLFKGRTTYTLSRTSRAARQRRQTKEDLTESEQVIADIEEQIDRIQQQFEAEIHAVNEKWARAAAEVQPYVITPYKKDIQTELFGVGWIPHYYAEVNGQPLLLPAL
jgi:hypothetical protein